MVGRTRPGPVLITGCSSGIGRAAALSLHQAGFTVYATARRTETLADLSGHRLRTLALDVTLVAMNRVLPARAYDSMLRRQYGLPR